MSLTNLVGEKEREFIKNYNYEAINDSTKFTSIILVTYNQLNYTKICIESIRKFTLKNSYEIIIIDNNSSDDTVRWLKEQKDIILIENSVNLGFPIACNQGIEIAKGDSILLLNNDTIVTENWLNNLNKALYSSDEIGAVGAITNSASNGQQIEVKYNNIEEMLTFAANINKSISKDNWNYKIRLIGFCLLFKKKILEEVGVLDERFSPGNYEDDDISFRIIEKGYKLILCKNVFIHHFGGASFGRDQKFFQLNVINETKFKLKWGFTARYSAIVRYDLLQLIDEVKDKKMNLLDVGCGVGATLLELKNIYRNSNIYGIENSEEVGKITKGVCNGLIGNIEDIEIPYEEKFFDYIILGDVLEHLVNPTKVLTNLNKYLKDEGKIIVSIPNIMHISVIKALLNGRFKYEEAGILDKTHLRFFTLTEIRELLVNSGFREEFITGTLYNINEGDKEFIEEIIKITKNDLTQQFNIYQYLIKACKI